MLTAWEHVRLHEGRWVGADDRLVDPEALRECVTLTGPVEPAPGRRYVIGVDVELTKDRIAIAVEHAERVEVLDGDGTPRRATRVVLDLLLVFNGTRARPVQLADVEAALGDLWREYHRPRILLDPWQAVGLAQRLRGRGARVEEFAFTSQSVGRLGSTLHVLLRDRLLALPPDEALLGELAHVRLRETSPGVVRLDHGSGRHDDRAVAIALAAETLVRQGATGTTTLHVPRGSIAAAQRRAPRSRLTEASIGRDGTPSPTPRRRPARLVDATRVDGPTAAAEDDGHSVWERRGFPLAVADALRRRW